jgi:hypothetical protein
MVPVAEQGASSSTASKSCVGLPRQRISHHGLRIQSGIGQVLGDPRHTRRGQVQRRDRPPLRPVAASCRPARAQIQHTFARLRPAPAAGRAAAASCTHQSPSLKARQIGQMHLCGQSDLPVAMPDRRQPCRKGFCIAVLWGQVGGGSRRHGPLPSAWWQACPMPT